MSFPLLSRKLCQKKVLKTGFISLFWLWSEMQSVQILADIHSWSIYREQVQL